MENLNIRQATAADLSFVVEFNEAMALETENKILDHDTITSGVKNLFSNPQYGFYIVVEIDNEVCASLMITTEWSDWRDGLFWWIQSVYVKPAHRRKGIYTKMYNYIKELAKEHPEVCGFRLYVEQDNTPAQKTYENNGMEKTHYLLYEEISKKK